MRCINTIIPFYAFLISISSPFLAWSDDEVIFEKALSYTVEIQSQIKIPFTEDVQGVFGGAGFLIDKKRGWILTNAHVTSYSPAQISVSFKDEDFVPSETVYVDPYLDLAIIKFPPEKITADKKEAELNCDESFNVGHPVGAFGHPWGFSYTGTKGIISGKTSRFGNQLLQTDAPINSGNSGGPLISLKTGQVVAINTSSIDDDTDQNTNFAEQIKFVCRVLELLKQGKDPSPAKLPVSFLVDPFKGDTMVVSNLYMKNNLLNLQVDDQIVRVVGYDPIKIEGELIHDLRGRLNKFSLEVLRNGVSKIISGKLERHDPIINRKGVIVSGMLLSDYWIRDKPVLNLPEFLIHFVQPGSLAEGELIISGDYLESLNGNTFKTIKKLYSYLKENEGREMKMKILSTEGTDENYYLTHYEHTLPVQDVRIIGGLEE